ncbi:ABC transporter substrate-binding protein, partial [Enterococcus faecalis]|uniref:ABC transporter substrate-binding protein n=2 Tax=Enterococcus TaxID=1350 RepID=UPI000668BEE9
MKKKFLAMMAVSMMGLLMLSACQTNKKTADSATTETTAKTEVTVKDTNGQLTVPKNPQKVVVFDNGSLDTMDALGVGDRVVGAPTKNIPAYLKKYQKVESAGGIKEPDLEKINQLKPDLIIISGRQQDYQEQLKAIAPTIYLAVDAKNPWESTKQNIETLGTIFDKEEVAKEKIT